AGDRRLARRAAQEGGTRMKWVRSIAAAILGVIAVLGLLASVVGFWARDTVFDESEVAGAVEAAIEEPGVTDALAARLADSIMAHIDLETRLNNILPPALQRITPAIVGGTTQVLEDRLTNRFADPDTRNFLVNSFERSYARFLDVLEGDGLAEGVTVADGEVTVNFLPLVADGLQRLQKFGLLDDATIPELSRDGDPTEQIAQLSEGLGRELPADFGQIVVYRSDSLAAKGETVERAQQALVLIKRSFVLILAVTVVAIAGTLLVARKRMRAAFALLLGSAATFVVVRAVAKKVLEDVPSVARTAAGQAALAAATSSLADSLVKALGVLAVLFLVGAIVVYMLDANSAVRRRAAARSGSPTFGAAVAAYRVPVALVAAAGALLVITIGGFTVLSLVVALLLVVLAMYALWAPDAPALDAPAVEPAPPAPSADGTIS
ncbi:MAG TPA: hypothetical protein VL916_12105, partial [Ilumatobacteraceae bacterium]|nr:hypothetical protein [Ilumatobacteraceae bacterium]